MMERWLFGFVVTLLIVLFVPMFIGMATVVTIDIWKDVFASWGE